MEVEAAVTSLAGKREGGKEGGREGRTEGKAYLRRGNGSDELGPVLGDALVLVLPTHHEASDVLRKGGREGEGRVRCCSSDPP